MSTPLSPNRPVPPRRRWIVAVAIVGIAAVGTGLAVWSRAGDGRQRDEALIACRTGAFADAEPRLKEVLAAHPDDVEVLDCLARGYVKAGRTGEAEPLLTKLIGLRPNAADYVRMRLDIYRQAKRWESAAADGRRLAELEPGDEAIRRSAANLTFSAGDFARAEEACRALLGDYPGDRRLRALLSDIRRARGDEAEAGQILDELIREDPTDYGPVQARGILYDETGHPDQAVPLLQRAFDNDPRRRRTVGYQLALALGKLGRQDEAEKVLAEVRRLQDRELAADAIKSQPDNLALQVRLAESLFRDGATADGMSLLDQVLRRDPRFAPAHRALADQYAREGKADLAEKHRKLAAQSP